MLEPASPIYEPPKYTTQFSLWQLFTLTTATAIALAAGGRWIRSLAFTQLAYAGLALILILVAYAWGNYWFAATYARTIEAIGKPIGEVPYRPLLPRFLKIGSLGVLVLVSLALVGSAIKLGSLSYLQRMANVAQGSVIIGICLAVIRKRVAVKPLLIYGDQGVFDGDHTYAWSAVTIRAGQTRNTITLRRPPLTETVAIEAEVVPMIEAKQRAS